MDSTTKEFPFEVTPFKSSIDVLKNYGSLFVILCMRYLRTNIEKIINDAGGYSPKSVALSELIETVSGVSSTQGEEWLNSRSVPTLQQCNDMAWALREYIRRCTDLTYEENPESANTILPIENLKQNFHLTELELYIVVSCAVIQYDDRYAHAWRYVTGAGSDELPTAGFLIHLLSFLAKDEKELHQCLDPSGALMRYGLISLQLSSAWNQDTPLGCAPISVPRRIVSYFLGEASSFIPEACRFLADEEQNAYDIDKQITKSIQKSLQKSNVRLGLMGYRGIGRTAALYHVAQKINMPVMVMNLEDVAKIGNQYINIVSYLSIVLREIRMHRAILLIELSHKGDHLDSETESWLLRHSGAFRSVLGGEDLLRLCVLLPRQNSLSHELFGDLSEIQFPDPDREDQPRFWLHALKKVLSGQQAATVAETMAKGYCLSYYEITSAIEQTLVTFSSLSAERALTPDNISNVLNKTRGQKLEGMATLRNTTLYLKDLVLSDKIRQTLDEIISYARYSEMVMQDWGFSKYNASGAGLSVLLSGVPGTGKTLTALVLAHELGRALYVVDLSRVVDKYIGETEKKLSIIFDEAERSQAMLLFDEADSLFAKRTDVKSSNDRYANLEVNYLLQRLEAYRGVTLLTTNFSDGLDEALARRIQFKLEFPMPDSELRMELWRKLIPPGAPRDENIDLRSIAEHFEMSGGHIKNAIFRAAIQAASSSRPISYNMLWDAAAHEYRSMGHIIRDDYEEDEEIPDYRFNS